MLENVFLLICKITSDYILDLQMKFQERLRSLPPIQLDYSQRASGVVNCPYAVLIL